MTAKTPPFQGEAPPANLRTLFQTFYRHTNFEKRRKAAYNKKNYTLTNIRKLLAALGNPQDSYEVHHVAGTKGKGSTVHYLAAIFTHWGYKTGATLSPHLVDERERFLLNMQPIGWERLGELMRAVLAVRDRLSLAPTVFDLFTAMALLLFKEEKVEIACLETGLGGRLDSTNVVARPKATYLTALDFDHTDKLGNTLEKIAFEKAGIIKPGAPVFYLRPPAGQEAVGQVFSATARRLQAPQFVWQGLHPLFEEYEKAPPPKPYLPFTLRQNCSLVLHSLGVLYPQRRLTLAQLQAVLARYPLAGRYQRVGNFLLDGAHTPAAVARLVEAVREDPSLSEFVVAGRVRVLFYAFFDKQIESMVRLFPAEWRVCFVRLRLFFVPAALEERAVQAFLRGRPRAEVVEAGSPSFARLLARRSDGLGGRSLCILTGSFKLVGLALTLLSRGDAGWR